MHLTTDALTASSQRLPAFHPKVQGVTGELHQEKSHAAWSGLQSALVAGLVRTLAAQPGLLARENVPEFFGIVEGMVLATDRGFDDPVQGDGVTGVARNPRPDRTAVDADDVALLVHEERKLSRQGLLEGYSCNTKEALRQAQDERLFTKI